MIYYGLVIECFERAVVKIFFFKCLKFEFCLVVLEVELIAP